MSCAPRFMVSIMYSTLQNHGPLTFPQIVFIYCVKIQENRNTRTVVQSNILVIQYNCLRKSAILIPRLVCRDSINRDCALKVFLFFYINRQCLIVFSSSRLYLLDRIILYFCHCVINRSKCLTVVENQFKIKILRTLLLKQGFCFQVFLN